LEGDQRCAGADDARQLATTDQTDVKDTAADISLTSAYQLLVVVETHRISDASTADFVAGSKRSVAYLILAR